MLTCVFLSVELLEFSRDLDDFAEDLHEVHLNGDDCLYFLSLQAVDVGDAHTNQRVFRDFYFGIEELVVFLLSVFVSRVHFVENVGLGDERTRTACPSMHTELAKTETYSSQFPTFFRLETCCWCTHTRVSWSRTRCVLVRRAILRCSPWGAAARSS